MNVDELGTEVGRWKTIAAKLAYMVVTNDLGPTTSEQEKERAAASLLSLILDVEARPTC